MTPINIFLIFLPSSTQYYQVSFFRNSFRNRFQLHFSNSTGFDVAKTGDARIGFVGKSSETYWKTILLYKMDQEPCHCSNSMHFNVYHVSIHNPVSSSKHYCPIRMVFSVPV